MKKVLLIMAAALMTMTQCRKQETSPATPSADTIKMTITAGPGAKTDITNEGAITWTSGDVLYVSDGTSWLGSLTLQSGAGNASGTFTGNISEISDGTTCHFFYLGHDNGMAAPTANTTTDVSISFASQDGTRGGALKYHLGHGSAKVTVSGGVATGAVAMRTEIAMAHLKFKMDDADYTGSVTMDVSNTMTVSPAGTFSGSDNGINIGNNGGSGDRYVTLIPTTGTGSVDVSFSGSATGSMTFGHGIQANNLYGMENGIAVTLESDEYVDLGLSVKWATCNVGADSPEKYGWYFMWGSTTNDGGSNCSWENCPGNGGNSSCYEPAFNTWKSSNLTNNNVLKPEVDAATANWGGDWRMPTTTEWQELYSNTKRTWTTEKGVYGCKFTSNKYGYKDKYIFLPAAGRRKGTDMKNVGSNGFYWSSSLNSSTPSYAYYLSFNSSSGGSQSSCDRYYGYSVRPVRKVHPVR